jgi:transcriptional regulator with GAF, ATPase, and Fis domain
MRADLPRRFRKRTIRPREGCVHGREDGSRRRFELADGGTLFLDEIANVPMNLQAKLLRVLEVGEMERVGSSKTRRVDARVIFRHQCDPQRRSQRRPLSAGPAVPSEHH